MSPAAPSSATSDESGGRRRSRQIGVVLAASAFLAIHFCLAVLSKLNASTTSDELVHLTAGLSYWKNNDYRLHPENGNLPQRWAALPAWLAGARFPELTGNDSWRTSDVGRLGHQFFYENGEDHFPRLMSGRAMIALFSVGTGVLVFLWSRRQWGPAGGLVSLALFTFSPDFLAHGALVTSDVCMAFFFLAAMGAWWRHLHDGRARTWWLSAIVLGLAFVAKYSAVLLVPMMIATAAVRAFSSEPWQISRWKLTTPMGKFGAAAISALGHAGVVVVVIWVFYGFRFTAFNPTLPPADNFAAPWSYFLERTGRLGEATRALATFKVLPEGFLYGFDYVLATTQSRSAFLNGEHSVTGWRTFFAWTFLFKTTLALLCATVVVAVMAAYRLTAGRKIIHRLYPWSPLLALLGVYGISSLTSQLNIGHRHILPLYPVLFIAAGALGSVFVSGLRLRATLVAGLLCWHAFEAVRIAPFHLAYFNALAGGPAKGWRHLVDSSLDWGQDLPALKRWLEKNAGSHPVYLSYFGTAEPDYYGLTAHRLTFINNFKREPRYVKLEAGTYCISATIVQQVYSPVTGPWAPDREKEYQELRQLEPLFHAFTEEPGRRTELLQLASVEHWRNGIRRHELLRMARLSSYLRLREPDANAGYSILIYRLSGDEVRRATASSWSEWGRLLEETSSIAN